MRKIYQQGDVVLKSINKIPMGERIKKKNLVLAEGEHTGHKHEIVWPIAFLETEEKPAIEFFSIGGIDYISCNKMFKVRHEEHKIIEVPAGDYEITIVQEYDHFAEEARNVAD